MSDFLNSVKADLLDRRLLPFVALVVLALVAAVAYAVLGGGSSRGHARGFGRDGVRRPPRAWRSARRTPEKAVAETTGGVRRPAPGQRTQPLHAAAGTARRRRRPPLAASSNSSLDDDEQLIVRLGVRRPRRAPRRLQPRRRRPSRPRRRSRRPSTTWRCSSAYSPRLPAVDRGGSADAVSRTSSC